MLCELKTFLLTEFSEMKPLLANVLLSFQLPSSSTHKKLCPDCSAALLSDNPPQNSGVPTCDSTSPAVCHAVRFSDRPKAARCGQATSPEALVSGIVYRTRD